MPEPYLHNPFAAAALPAQLQWHCEPRRWSLDPASRSLRVEPDAATDFWQRTHYGFQADNGHFLHASLSGDFILTVQVRFHPVHQYDQAGLLVRVSPTCWLKSSVEYEPDRPSRLGAVVTNFGYSDWSTQAFPSGTGSVWLRARREDNDYIIDASANGVAWEQLRMAHLHEGCGAAAACGIYACSPKVAGFVAEFLHLTIDRGRLGK
jgi:uncharacterized protein